MSRIAGVDEAGRGPLAGPVYAAAVVLAPGCGLPLEDSKRLSPNRRQWLFPQIRAQAVGSAIASASVREIDRLGILAATLLAMSRALDALGPLAEAALIDGCQVPDVLLPCRAVVRGDQTVPAISAASILAKVARDELMVELDRRFPVYGFARHKGYPTRDHIDALMCHGPCSAHRRSFAPVRRAMDLMT